MSDQSATDLDAAAFRARVAASDSEATGVLGATPAPAGATPRPSPRPGEIVGQYELIRSLGRGGMGEVFLARDSKLGRRVAVKFISVTDAEAGERLLREARATAQCSHENIVVIHDAGVASGWHYMVLEYLQGRTLADVAAEGQTLSPGRAVELIVPVVRALARTHAEGIVHRDLKPDNVFLTDSGTVKVLDFGIACAFDAATSRDGTVMGTLRWMSPEQWGAGQVDHRTDIWAVGLLLFRLLSGHHPLAEKQGAALAVTADLDVPMPSLEAAPGVPTGLARVVDRCLAKRPADRFQSATELLDALTPWLPTRVSAELAAHETPFTGLESFQEADAGRFFGRTDEIAMVVNRLRSRALLGLVGPSGVGKSSFVRAGVVPALKRSGEPWRALVVRPSRSPIDALVDALHGLSGTAGRTMNEIDLTSERLRREPGAAGAAFRAWARKSGSNVLLFVDQFEELFTLVPDPVERRVFLAALMGIADDPSSPTRVLLTLRADFLDRVSEDRHFIDELTQGLVFLNAPRREGLAEALVRPAELAGYRFEREEIVNDMLAHLEATQGALPLLQFTASRLWDARDRERKLLTMSSYQAMGGIAGALAAHADAVLRELTPQAQHLARLVLPRLVTPERTRALVSIDELRELTHDGAAVEQLVNQLVRARLLVVQTSAGSATVELVHETLVLGWPLLRRWLDEGREDQAFRDQLRAAVRQWDARGRDEGLLWRGDAVLEARAWRARQTSTLGERESAFLDAVFALADRARRRRRGAVSAVISVLLVVLAVGAVALQRVRSAERLAVEQAGVAKFEASRAREAEQRATDQLVKLIEEQTAKSRAEALVEQSRGDLQVANRQLEAALHTARVESGNARAAATRANELATSLKGANDSLERLLSEERKRADRLEQERKKIVTELR